MSITTNQPAVVDEAAFTVRRTIRIAADIAKVWEAVTVAEHISRWFGRTVLVGEGGAAVGTMTFPGRVIPLQVEAFEPPHLVAYRWCNDDAAGQDPAQVEPEHSTVFTFTLTPAGEGTELTVVETGFDATSDAAFNMASHREGWTLELDKLVALLDERS